MADATKAQKLAAARKKLKEYQQKSQKPNKTVPEADDNVTLSETLSNSTHSSINGNYDVSDIVPSESASNLVQTSPFHNYFNGNQQAVSHQESNNFFDNLYANFQSNDNIMNDVNNKVTNSDCLELDQSSRVQSFFNNANGGGVSTVINNDEDVRSLDYPELQQSDMYDYFHKLKTVEHPSVSSEDAKKLSDYMSIQSTDVLLKEETNLMNFQDSPNEEGFTPIEKRSCHKEDPDSALSLNSNTESLRQLSSQITELIKHEESSTPAVTNELEQRNQELACLLDQERLESQKAQAQLQESLNRVKQLESETQQIKIECEHRLNRELGPLQEQLQCHAQTVGILVGEKTELSTALSQSQLVTKQKITECEELQGRLKASRSRVADMEKELQVLKLEKSSSEQNGTHEEIGRLTKELQELKNNKEETAQDLLEVREKLNVKTNENLSLQKELKDVSHQWSLAQVKIEQITAGDSLQTESQVEVLTQQKLALEKQVLELSQALKTTGEERDQASAMYQYYVQQLNGQVASLASKLESLTNENENLTNREQNLIKHVGELEKHLQTLQEEHVNFNKGSSTEIKKELESVLESLQSLQIEKGKLEETHKGVLGERDDLLREVANSKEIIEKLENQLERVQGDQPDNVKLLAAMESDKVAASRAVSQNAELKQQLEEMHQAFVKMSNDKLDLTEKLTSEEYKTAELTEKLHQVETQLHTLSDAINIKDNELTQMRETLVHQNKQILQQDQLADRLRHYEAQGGSSHVLQIELQNAQDQIQVLMKENSKLKQELEDDNLQNLTRNVNINQVVEETSNVKLETEDVGDSSTAIVPKLSSIECQTINTEEGHVLDANILDKEVAMKHLGEKFTRTMLDIANLTEEKQRLEHLVTQLQEETETIGEYIALYQHQRGILKQRTQEKDEQLRRLAQDREKVRTKLDALNELVKKLVLEKGVLTPEILEQHQKLNSQSHELCSEHARIQQEIDKITHQNLKSSENGIDYKETAHINENNNLSTETAEEIIALLAEIKSSSLIQPSDGLENFHPCPWCSGQLLTV